MLQGVSPEEGLPVVRPSLLPGAGVAACCSRPPVLPSRGGPLLQQAGVYVATTPRPFFLTPAPHCHPLTP